MQGDGNLVIYDKNGSAIWDRYQIFKKNIPLIKETPRW